MSTMVLFAPSANGEAALAQAVRAGAHAPLIVVALAPADGRTPACVSYTPDLERAVRAEAERDLHRARTLLGRAAPAARFAVVRVTGGRELAAWACAQGVTVAVLGARRGPLRDLPRYGHALRRAGIDVSVAG